ncbi:hypothetical protein CTAYLR_008053 [Chrysophaeum taylorii]|uniref:Uncharacterized protein n=1 Tax=Chrysophaeum taylorii TaxID=2483200 RepID=A0AAD7XNG8_9STRA|nr:hypothetical protein CTAYLR_008053 [Chrysophaeum taylorii]
MRRGVFCCGGELVGRTTRLLSSSSRSSPAASAVLEATPQKKVIQRAPETTTTKTTTTTTAEQPVAIAVVGGGRMGEIRCQHIARSGGARLEAFVDVDPSAAASLASRHAGCEAYVALDDVFATKKIDAVWICAPTPAHADLIATSARASAHVAVEKPVAMSAVDIRNAYDVCEQHNVHLTCAFQRRCDASYAAVAEAVADGRVGAPRSIRSVFRDHPAPPTSFLRDAGGDPFHDIATHDIDYILSMVKQQLNGSSLDHHPDEVWACGTSSTRELRENGVYDAATVVLKWKRGDALELCATLDIARGSAYGYDQRVEVYGTLGNSVCVTNQPGSNVALNDNTGTHRGPLVHSFPQRFDQAFAQELEFFLECVRGNATPKVTSHDAQLATIVAEAALQSARHDTVVKFTRDDRNDELHLRYTPTTKPPREEPTTRHAAAAVSA